MNLRRAADSTGVDERGARRAAADLSQALDLEYEEALTLMARQLLAGLPLDEAIATWPLKGSPA